MRNVDDVIKTKPETVWYFAYSLARDVPSGAEVAIVGCRPPRHLCGSANTATQMPWRWWNSVK